MVFSCQLGQLQLHVWVSHLLWRNAPHGISFKLFPLTWGINRKVKADRESFFDFLEGSGLSIQRSRFNSARDLMPSASFVISRHIFFHAPSAIYLLLPEPSCRLAASTSRHGSACRLPTGFFSSWNDEESEKASISWASCAASSSSCSTNLRS